MVAFLAVGIAGLLATISVSYAQTPLYQGDSLVDETHIANDCNAVDPSTCTEEAATGVPSLAGATLLASVSVAAMVLLVALGHKARRDIDETQSISN